jgi:hypothetical protein
VRVLEHGHAKNLGAQKNLVQENPHEAKVCYSATYDAGNNSETAHTDNVVARNYRDGFRRSNRFWLNSQRNWHYYAKATNVVSRRGANT